MCVPQEEWPSGKVPARMCNDPCGTPVTVTMAQFNIP